MVDSSKLSREAKHALNAALTILEHAMDLALQKEDLDAIIAISDRMMLLYQHLAEKDIKKFKPGFAFIDQKKSEATEDEYESD